MRGNTLKSLAIAKTVFSMTMWAVLFLVSLATAQAATTINLAWDAVSGASGYRVYQAETNETAVNLTTQHVTDASPVVANPTGTTATVNVAEGKTYYFAVKAYNDSAMSGFSNEVGKTVPAVAPAPAPVASFSATPLSGTAPLTVKFTNTSTGGTVNTWCWKFVNPNSSSCDSSVQNPPDKTYDAGTYYVSLVATGPGGTSTATPQTITVSAPPTTAPAPVADFTADPVSGDATPTLSVTLKDTSTGTNIAKRTWNFGDGNSTTVTTAQNFVRSYAYGTYSVSLTLKDSADKVLSTKSQTITAKAVPPAADFSATTTATPLTVKVSNSSTGTVTSWSWNFGDGGTSSVQNPPDYAYKAAGTYTISLTATGTSGTTPSTKTQTITVSAASASTGGLVAAYNFAEAGGNTVVDASGNGNHGTIFNSATRTSSGKFDNALTFGGTKYVTVPNASSLDIGGKGLTLSFFANITDTGRDQVLIDKPWHATSYPSPYYQYAVEYMAGSKTFVLFLGDTGGNLRTYSMAAPLGTWTHIAFTYDGANVRGYVNGALKFATPATFSIQAKGNPLRIGLDHTGGQPTNGSLDEIRLYNRALTATEIQTDLNTAIATSSPPQRLLGTQTLGSVSDALPQRTAAAFQTTAAATGQITNLSVYVDAGSAATSLIAGLYADSNGRPGTLIATGTLSAPKVGSWNTVRLPATQVTAGARYWIAILSPSGQLKFRSRAGSIAQPSETSKSTRLTSLPSTWATGTVSANGPLSGYGAGY